MPKIVLDTRTAVLNPRRSKEFIADSADAAIEAARAYLDAWMRKHAPNVRSDAFMSKAVERMTSGKGFSWDFRTPSNHLASVNAHVYLHTH
jgi:hypothetical protein